MRNNWFCDKFCPASAAVSVAMEDNTLRTVYVSKSISMSVLQRFADQQGLVLKDLGKGEWGLEDPVREEQL